MRFRKFLLSALLGVLAVSTGGAANKILYVNGVPLSINGGVFSTAAAGSGGTALFSDGVESGNWNHTENGISYGGHTSNVAVNTTNPYQGSYSIFMPYPGDGGTPSERNNEQDIVLTTPMTEIWVGYYLWVPSDFYHRSTGCPSGSCNNKGFLSMWDGDYAGGYGPAYGPNFFTGSALPNIVLSPGEDRQKLQVFNGYGLGGGQHFDFYADDGNPALMGYGFTSDMYGKWCHIVTHAKYATAANNDGVYQNWKQCTGASTYTILLNLTAIPAYVPGATGFDHLRILGYSNSGFAVDTDFYVDNIQIAATNIFGVTLP